MPVLAKSTRAHPKKKHDSCLNPVCLFSCCEMLECVPVLVCLMRLLLLISRSSP